MRPQVAAHCFKADRPVCPWHASDPETSGVDRIHRLRAPIVDTNALVVENLQGMLAEMGRRCIGTLGAEDARRDLANLEPWMYDYNFQYPHSALSHHPITRLGFGGNNALRNYT